MNAFKWRARHSTAQLTQHLRNVLRRACTELRAVLYARLRDPDASCCAMGRSAPSVCVHGNGFGVRMCACLFLSIIGRA